MKLRIEVLDDEGHAAEVLVINGGAEDIATMFAETGQSTEVDVAAPVAVVLREKPEA